MIYRVYNVILAMNMSRDMNVSTIVTPAEAVPVKSLYQSYIGTEEISQ